ncbi:mushroom body large-type Kenyon cell-specific protein 1 isoform X2 [Uranotaenia lowii]|uniref:mushroom body large-type Kenyon cell-specific protein 1 isoform X2 n=1 Tax=Uranotaenia lowii TaxID=190385 RepID=UPI00247AE4F9|nr:mushroom body large-type Kenyon cell-specific protein 1 isoform X2 [Uranotaenia lowii]
MADCSYARCVQERRYIRRELAKWTKTMVHIVGLERAAEELMGRRKWKHYQDVLTRQQLNLLVDPTTAPLPPNNNTSAAAILATSGSAASAIDQQQQQQQQHLHQHHQSSGNSPATMAATLGGNHLGTHDGKGVVTIVRNGHYQPPSQLSEDDNGGILESKLVATSHNQQVVSAADKQADHHHNHPQLHHLNLHPTAAAALIAETAAANNKINSKQQNHFNENDSRPTETTTANNNNNNSSSASARSPIPSSNKHSSSNSNNNGSSDVATALLNNHHPHPLHHHHQRNSTESMTVAMAAAEVKKEAPSSADQRIGGSNEAETPGDKTLAMRSSPALSTSSGTTSATTSTSTTMALLSPAELEERKEQIVGNELTTLKEEAIENQNLSEQGKLIKQENCNNLLSNKLIINNNNSSSANNNNNNSISNDNPAATTTTAATASENGAAQSVLSKRLQQEQPPTPVDWKAQDKCYFCVDGKLLVVNEAGELVPETDSAAAEAATLAGNRQLLRKMELGRESLNDSDSDSSDSSEPDLRALLGRADSASRKSLAALLARSATSGGDGGGGADGSLQSSLAAQFAAVASLQGIQPGLAQFYGPLWYQQLQQQLSPSGGANEASGDGEKPERGGGKSGGTGGDGPLDLSAKPGTSGLNPLMSMMDPKHIYKAKPRLSPTGGRRTYTEDELQNALQDILNGKLGTRRAAVQYGIPRSTLRNKVYKLAIEREREMLSTIPLTALIDDDDDDKDSIEDDGKEDSLAMKLNQQAIAEAYLRMYRGDSSTPKPEPRSTPSTPPQHQTTPEPPLLKPIQPQTPLSTGQPQSSPLAAAANSMIDPNLILQIQSLLLAGGIPGLTNTATQSKNPEEAAAAQASLSTLSELLKKLLHQQELIAEQLKRTNVNEQHIPQQRPNASTPTLNNGQPFDPRLLFMQQNNKPRTASGTPETTSSMDLNDGGSDDSQVILKIPSYKPIPGSTPIPVATSALLSASGKNGELHHSLSTPSPPTTAATSRDLSSLVMGPGSTPNLNNSTGSTGSGSSSTRPIHTASPQQSLPQLTPNQLSNHHHSLSSVMSASPLSNSQSPPNLLGSGKLSINDVIVRSISKNFQQHHQSDLLKQQMDHMERYKRPTISVIKNLGGTDISHFGTNPNITQINAAAQLAAANAAGKGTRPKRGKYRNYDRDSLVEAVKAVQRGEMSVHRAGSYYGVPHSTLEYKVKERHLMRPRKREPKPQPGLDGLKSELGGMRSLDKSKSLGMGAKMHMKNAYPGASPNGSLKMPMFDAAMASQLPYTSPFLWPHHASNFPGIPMTDFGRQSASGSGSAPSADNIFASPMMQRFQQEGKGHPGNSGGTVSTAKSARELAESIYDGTNTNGSLLDDIIRHSLDKKPGDLPHGALFDQLMKKNNLHPPSLSESHDDPTAALLAKASAKRSAASPLNFLPDQIKRERASPDAESTSSAGSSKPGGLGGPYADHHHQHHHHHQQQQQRLLLGTDSADGNLLDSHRAELIAKGNRAVEDLIKLREDLTSMSAAHHHKRTSMEDQHNGGGSGGGQGSDLDLSHHQQRLMVAAAAAAAGKHSTATAAIDDSS